MSAATIRNKMGANVIKATIAVVIIWLAHNILHSTVVQGAEARPDCVNFPHGSINPIIQVCKTNARYVFRLGDDIIDFTHHDFESRISAAAREWVSAHQLDPKILDQSPVDIWLGVPDINPLEAQPRAIVKTTLGTISFWFDLKANSWTFDDHQTAIIGNVPYPKSFGYRPEMILAQALPNASDDAVKSALIASGGIDVKASGHDSYTATCKVFNESPVAWLAASKHSDVLKSAQPNDVVEWIAERQLVFSFKLLNN